MPISIGEFLAPVRNRMQRDLVVAAIFYATQYQGAELLASEDVRALLVRGQVPKARQMNVARALAEAGENLDSPGMEGGRKLWKITDTGKAHVRQLLGLPAEDPEVSFDVASLLARATLLDPESRDYVEEGIKCLQFGALRATVVFLWAGAVRKLYGVLLGFPKADVQAALLKHDQKARIISKIEDFSAVRDANVLLIAQELGYLDKSERQMLEHALDLRNKCGHPGKYSPGPKKVSAFVEDLLAIVFR